MSTTRQTMHDHDALHAMIANARDAEDAERAYARDAFRAGDTILYCRGPGWPVVALSTPEQWEQRDALSRRRN